MNKVKRSERYILDLGVLAANAGRVHRLSFFFFLFPFLFALCSLGCSSAPKRADEIFFERNTAAKQLALANTYAGQGRFEDALYILEDAWRLVLGTDDPTLRVKTTVSRGSILFSLGRQTEAFQAWESAAAEGDAWGEHIAAAQARIYEIRARLVLLGNDSPDGGPAADAAARELKTRLSREMDAVKADSHSTAAAYVTLGLAEKQLRRWADAESAVMSALAIHEKNRFLEDAAYDWFLIASIRSVAGNYDAALEALKTAIRFDRRAENGFGLASSWQAMGDVYQKAGRTEESLAAHHRAAEIFRAINLNDRAEKLTVKQ